MKVHLSAITIEKFLLFCGILYGLLYISTDAIASMLYKGYSYSDQQVSELSAIGAPTRFFWITMSLIITPLLIAFGIGVLRMAYNRAMRITGVLLAIWGITGYFWLFFPMHLRGANDSFTDTMHLVMAGITVPLMMVFIGFGAAALGIRFRFYSIVTILFMLISGFIVSTQVSSIGAGLSTPWMGLVERVSVYSPMVWIIVFATSLLHLTCSRIRTNEKTQFVSGIEAQFAIKSIKINER